MKKFLTYIVLFFAAVGVIDLAVGFAGDYMVQHARGGTTKEFNDLLMNDSHDILVLGSSRALHHYDTPFLSDTLGLDVYNAGHKGNGIILADGILEMVLRHSVPRLVVCDVEPAYDIYEYDDDHDRRYLSSLKPYWRFPEISRIFKDVSKKEWLKVHSGLYRFNTSIITLAVDHSFVRAESSGGFSPLSGSLKQAEAAKTNLEKAVDSLKLYHVERLIKAAQKKSVPLVFIASPKSGVDDSRELAPVKTICARYGVPFLDFYAASDYAAPYEWFQDPVHLNAVGARHFSADIAGHLLQYMNH